MIDVRSDNAKLWKSEHTTRDGRKFYSYTVGISKKVDSGYINKYIKLFRKKGIDIPADTPNGATIKFKGFLALDTYTDKTGKEVSEPAIMATELYIEGTAPQQAEEPHVENTGFATTEDDIPF